MLEEDVLDFARIDVLAAADDHVLLAVDEEEVAVRVDVADVSRVEPPAAEGFRGRVRVPEVADHDVRPAEADFATLAGSHLVAFVVEDSDLLAAEGSPDRTDLPGSPERVERRRAHAFG